jgi:hypothetical protein
MKHNSATIEGRSSEDDIYDLQCELMEEYEFFDITANGVKTYYQVHCFGSESAYTFSSESLFDMSDKARPVFALEVIKAALEHVKHSHPHVVGVVFNSRGQWFYFEGDFGTPEPFGDEIDDKTLNEAADAAYVLGLPFIYEQPQDEDQ